MLIYIGNFHLLVTTNITAIINYKNRALTHNYYFTMQLLLQSNIKYFSLSFYPIFPYNPSSLVRASSAFNYFLSHAGVLLRCSLARGE